MGSPSKIIYASILINFAIIVSATLLPTRRDYSSHSYYALEYDPSGGMPLEECASRLNVELIEQIGELSGLWLTREKLDVTSSRNKDTISTALEVFERLNRWISGDNVPLYSREEQNLARSVRRLALQTPRVRDKRRMLQDMTISSDEDESTANVQEVAQRLGIDDPLFPRQWHLINEDYPQFMINATAIWDMGVTGQNVITALVDDGLDYTSEDIADNFDVAGSYDFNNQVNLPTPVLSDDNHGTRCGGQIAAVRNGVCGVGIAYDSKIAGIRILSGPITDADEAAALNYNYQSTSIYSCSWDPKDDGQSMDAPSYVIQKALVNGVQNGRDGKGSIFVFASGNGGFYGDQCNFDGYTNSIYSITVGAIDHRGRHTTYSESCAANMVVSYSSNGDYKIVTTDVGKNACTDQHGGTSAAAPNTVGIIALALSARPDLTWRDVQHLCVETAIVVNPSDPDWETTATGRLYSYKFGYGALDAYTFVSAALKWSPVKPQSWIEYPAVQLNNGTMTPSRKMSGGEIIPPGGISSSITITSDLLLENNFETLEHVTVTVWISHERRGDVEVELISPHGIRSTLAKRRPKDHDPFGYPGWKFMTLKHWGEDAVGRWTIRVSDQNDMNAIGYFLGWSMALYGAAIDPQKSSPYILPDLERMPFPLPDYHLPSITLTQVASTATELNSYINPIFDTPEIPTQSIGDKWTKHITFLRIFYLWIALLLFCIAFGLIILPLWWKNRRRRVQSFVSEATRMAIPAKYFHLRLSQNSENPLMGAGVDSEYTTLIDASLHDPLQI